MRSAAHRVLVALLLALIGIGYLGVGHGTQAQDDPVGGAGDGSLQLGLPFPVGEMWQASATEAHGLDINGEPRPAMRFNRTSDTGPVVGAPVLAMRGGVVSQPCAGMVKVDHGGGISSVYYPVGTIAVTAGQTVTRGQRLGGTTVSGGCSLYGYGNGTVDVWVQRNGVDISLVGQDVGGWTVRSDNMFERGATLAYNFLVVNDGEVGSTAGPLASVSTSGGGRVGELIDYRLDGFPANVPVTLEWRRADASVVPLGTTRTSPGGTAEGRVTTPETPKEIFQADNALVARTSTVTRRAFVFMGPSLTLSNDTFVRGETVTLRMTGIFASTSFPVIVQYAGQGPQSLPQQFTIDRFGTGTATVPISASAPLGQGLFQIEVPGKGNYGQVGFEIVGQPTVSFSFSPGYTPKVGESFGTILRKFPVNTDVTVVMQRKLHVEDPPLGPIYQLGTGRTDASGFASVNGTSPTDMDGGLFEVKATGGGRSVTRLLGIGSRFNLSPVSAPPGGQVTVDLTGWPVGYTLTLDWWDGELWQALGDYQVPSNRRLPLIVPTEATPGLSSRIGRREISPISGRAYWPDQLNLLITDPGSNSPPRANAGPDRTVTSTSDAGIAVTLSGSGSSDPGGSIASYTWRENGVQVATGVSPTVTLTDGEHTIQLTVVDNGGLAAVDTVVVTVRRAPRAGAGPDQSVDDPEGDGEVVFLRSQSSDPDSDFDLAYLWKEGTTTLATTAEFSRTFAPGVHTVVLTVTDVDGLTGTDTVMVTVRPPQPPVANAGADQTVADVDGGGEEVFLDGFGSTDADGTIVSWAWREGTRQIASGQAPAVTLAVGVHTIVLTVTDNSGRTATDTVVITVTGSRPPVANAGPDQTVADPEGNRHSVALTGAGSSDPDGTIASYVWREGTTQLATGPTPNVTLAVGVHTIVLTVTDNAGLTATDTVVVTVTGPPPPVRLTLNDLDTVNSKFNGVVTATLSGFAPNSAVALRWPRLFAVTATGPPTTDLLATGTTDATGRATLRFRTPLEPFLPTGYAVTARDATGKTDTATLRVIPRITLAPVTEGPTSTRLRVYFYGFSPNERIEVRWHTGPTNASGFVVIKTLTVAATGRASAIVVIPSTSAVGRHLVVGKVIGVSRSASTPFDVTAGGEAIDDPTATPTATASATQDVTETATPQATPTSTPEATPEATATPEPITTPTETSTPEPGPTDTPTPEPTPTDTPAPNASPVADAGEDQTVTDADGTGDEPVTLDGSASVDPEGGELTYLWTVDGSKVGTGPTPTATLSVGVTNVVLTVTDEQGATATDEITITVATAPVEEG